MQATLPISVTHIASCLPAQKVAVSGFADFDTKEVANLSKTTQIESLRWAANESAADLCVQAAKEIFNQEPQLKNEIAALIFVSQTPNQGMPASSYYCHSQLEFADDVACFDFQYGCSGYIYGLLQAGLLLPHVGNKKVLLLAGETNSKMTDPSDLQTRLIFGDAGTASIVESSSQCQPFIMYNSGSNGQTIHRKYGGFESNSEASEYLYMDGLGVFQFAISKVPTLVNQLLQNAHIEAEAIDYYIFHQANGFIVNYFAKALKLSPQKVPVALQDTGNTGPASIPLLLSKMGNDMYANTAQSGASLLCGFGVGLSWAACLLDLHTTTFYSPVIYSPNND
ncbi:hypothetical protein GC194_01205 [bacterium]|nr:hypothetical protein [bacterium]